MGLAACSSSFGWGLDLSLRRDCFARKVAVEHFFGSSQRDAKDERQCCEHDFVQQRYSQADVLRGKQRDQQAEKSADGKNEHTEGEASPNGTRKIRSDLGRCAQGY